ncbi:MAG: hypothetical protein K2N44_08415 [Lachnospiraceae bacterium]|nr:hypothetical protein [Lachnospiraceae bacterium]
MAKNEIADKVFEASAKLELMQTLISVMINMVEEREISTPEDAMLFSNYKDTLCDLLHITLDGVVEAKNVLSETGQKGGAA